MIPAKTPDVIPAVLPESLPVRARSKYAACVLTCVGMLGADIATIGDSTYDQIAITIDGATTRFGFTTAAGTVGTDTRVQVVNGEPSAAMTALKNVVEATLPGAFTFTSYALGFGLTLAYKGSGSFDNLQAIAKPAGTASANFTVVLS